MRRNDTLFSPRGIPANYREQEGAGVNTYKLCNDKGAAVLVKFHWIPKQGVRSLTTPEAAEIQKEEFSHATKDLYDAIDAGNFPEWEFNVQIMADGEHPELDFDPLDDTKQWPESQFPLRKVGRMVLNKKPDNFFAESEQSAFGTGVKVAGIEFSADKMLRGRTFSYSDTQRYRVGPNYQQLPINAPKREVHTNQRDGAMTRTQDAGGANPHVNYEPSILGGVSEARPTTSPCGAHRSISYTRFHVSRETGRRMSYSVMRTVSESTSVAPGAMSRRPGLVSNGPSKPTGLA